MKSWYRWRKIRQIKEAVLTELRAKRKMKRVVSKKHKDIGLTAKELMGVVELLSDGINVPGFTLMTVDRAHRNATVEVVLDLRREYSGMSLCMYKDAV